MTQIWLNQFESRLETLEHESAVTTASYANVLRLALSAASSLADVRTMNVYLVRPEGVEQIDENGTTFASTTTESQRLAELTTRKNTVVTSPSDSGQLFSVAHPLASDLSLLLESDVSQLIAPQQSSVEGIQAVCSVMATFISRQLLSQYAAQLSNQSALVKISAALHDCSSIDSAASVLVHDGAVVLNDCRLATLALRNGRYRVTAMTGVKEAKPESSAVEATESLAAAVARGELPADWITLSELNNGSHASAATMLAQTGVSRFRMIPFSDSNLNRSRESSAPNNTAANAASDASDLLVLQSFDSGRLPNEQLLLQLVNAATPVFRKLGRRSEIRFDNLIHSRLLRRTLIGLAIIAVLSFWPARFEIEVSGQIESGNQRRMFAAEDGTIDSVMFANEARVRKGQLLVTMTNPDLDLELQRVQGDIDTTSARLASVRAARLTGSDPRSSGDEQQLKKQLESLQRQQELITIQTSSLSIVAPFDGEVFLRNPERELSARPVQRGQLLFEVVPDDGNWQLSLQIPDHLSVYLQDANALNDSTAEVRYRIKAAPDQDWMCRLTSVDNAVQVVDGQLICHATALLDKLPATNLRPGTSVVARISCGQRSLGFVLFREVIEFWQQFRFAWL